MSAQALTRLTCGICHDENLQEVGELDSCNHSFCIKCILQWSKIESRCPFCKARFTKVTHKQLESVVADSDIVSEKFIGAILEEHIIPERNQRAPEDGQAWEEDPMDDVFCEGCGEGDHEDQIVLCDGCDSGWHTYCSGLREVPAGEWLCPYCTTEGQTAAPRTQSRAARRAMHRAATIERSGETTGAEQLYYDILGYPMTTPRRFSRRLTRAMRAAGAGPAEPPMERVNDRSGGRRERMNRAQRGRQRALDNEDGDDDEVIVVDESEEEASEEGSPERLPQRTRRAERRLRRRPRGEDDDPHDVDFRETTPGQRLPTPHRARRRTRSNSQAPRQAAWPRRMRSTNEVHASVATQAAAASLLPTRAHRNVESLRTSWEAIRQGQADFMGPACEGPAANEKADEEGEGNESESGDSDVPLSERVSAVQRALAVMERNRRIRAENLARRTQQIQARTQERRQQVARLESREERRQAAFGSFSAARAEQQRRHLQRVASRSPQRNRQASGTVSARPSRATILAQHLLDDERPRPTYAQPRQQELRPSGLQRQAAATADTQRAGSARADAQAFARSTAEKRERSSPEKQEGGPKLRTPGGPEPSAAERRIADEGKRRRIGADEGERRRKSSTPMEPATSAVGENSADAHWPGRESLEQVLATAKARPAQANPSMQASRAIADAFREPPTKAVGTSSAHGQEGTAHKLEAGLLTPSAAARIQPHQSQQVPEMTAAAPHLRQPHTNSATPWNSNNPIRSSAGAHSAGATSQWGPPITSASPYWQVYGTGATRPLPNMPQSIRSAGSGGRPAPWLTHRSSQPSVGVPPPPMPAPVLPGPLENAGQHSILPGSSDMIAPKLRGEGHGDAEAASLQPPREDRVASKAGTSGEGSARALGGSRLSERRSGTGSETSGNSSLGKFEPGQRAHTSEHGREEEFVRLKEKKNLAYRAVKALLDPLYKKGQLSSEEYKEAARNATHRLYKGTSEPNEAAWLKDAARAVKKSLDKN